MNTKPIIIILCISLCLIACNSGYTSSGNTVNTTDPLLITGEISKQELTLQQTVYLQNHPALQNDMSLWVNSSAYIPNYVKFMKVEPNPDYIPVTNNEPALNTNPQNMVLPSRRMLTDVKNIPALDQGIFGTCGTFSVLGAIEAASQAGYPSDTLTSPSCTIQMATQTIRKYNPWVGAWPGDIWSVLRNNGAIANRYANKGFCNTSSPTYQAFGSPSQSGQILDISLATYRQKSGKPAIPYHIVNTGTTAQSALNAIKRELNDESEKTPGQPTPAGFYPVINFWINASVMMVTADPNDGTGSHNYPAWFYFQPGAKVAGHAIYVFGYDDNVCVQTISPTQRTQCGVLFLRNSWGSNAGYNGNYLMTYDYFLANNMGGEVVSFANTNTGLVPL